jgi:hypothetical protein
LTGAPQLFPRFCAGFSLVSDADDGVATRPGRMTREKRIRPASRASVVVFLAALSWALALHKNVVIARRPR